MSRLSPRLDTQSLFPPIALRTCPSFPCPRSDRNEGLLVRSRTYNGVSTLLLPPVASSPSAFVVSDLGLTLDTLTVHYRAYSFAEPRAPTSRSYRSQQLARRCLMSLGSPNCIPGKRRAHSRAPRAIGPRRRPPPRRKRCPAKPSSEFSSSRIFLNRMATYTKIMASTAPQAIH